MYVKRGKANPVVHSVVRVGSKNTRGRRNHGGCKGQKLDIQVVGFLSINQRESQAALANKKKFERPTKKGKASRSPSVTQAWKKQKRLRG